MKIIHNPVWRNHNGEEVSDFKRQVSHWLRTYPKGEVFIGCDSKVRGNIAKYSTVICFWNVGRGVFEIYKNETIITPKDEYSRLWFEVTKAVEVADQLKDLCAITVHVDINSDPQFRSHQLYDASIGLINSMGFSAAGKPFSWAASCGAHRHCQ